MRHPVRDRFWILFCTLCALCVAAAAIALLYGKITVDPAVALLGRISNMSTKTRFALIGVAVVMVLFALRLFTMVLPKKKQKSSNFAIQQNENGMVRISVKALEALVQRCLSQHAELKVVTSSLHSDEESVRVDVHITLQSDISMPLAISSLQKQIKRYLEACAGVNVKEVRVFVEGATPATEATAQSPFAIPAAMLGREPLTAESEPVLLEVDDVPEDAEPVKEAVEETAETVEAEPVEVEAEVIEAEVIEAEAVEAEVVKAETVESEQTEEAAQTEAE